MKKLFFIVGNLLYLIVVVGSNSIYCNVNYYTINSANGMSQLQSYSKIQNPVFIADSSQFFGSAFYSPAKLGMRELSTSSAILGRKFFKSTTTSLSMIGNPSKLYQEYSISLSFAHEFDSFVVLATSINYSSIFIENNSNNYKFSLDLAGRINIFNNIYSGFLIKNLNRAYYVNDKFINQEVYVGLGIIPINNLYVDLDVLININKQSGLSLALAYQFEEFFKIRTTIKNNPLVYEIGIEFYALDYLSVAMMTDYMKNFGYYYLLGIGCKF